MPQTSSQSRFSGILKSLGPGLLWAGAAIGVSHLVQSTRAGATYGFAAATGENLQEGYKKLGNWAFVIYLILTFGMMFTIQAAVTVVTAGIASQLFGIKLTPVMWSGILLVVCAIVLMWGRYSLLDKL